MSKRVIDELILMRENVTPAQARVLERAIGRIVELQNQLLVATGKRTLNALKAEVVIGGRSYPDDSNVRMRESIARRSF